MEKDEKFEEVKGKIGEVFENIAEKVNDDVKDEQKKKVKPLVSCRILFVSILDKLYFIMLALSFVVTMWNFTENTLAYVDREASLFSSLGGIVWKFILILGGYAILYLILNWLYRCVAKTMICVTKNEVYGEVYYPFYRGEFSTPLSKVTKIDTIKVFWIFRTLIIHRYHQFPIIFATWNAQEFKDKAVELLLERNSKVENEYESRNILPQWLKKKILIVLIVLAALLVVVLGAFTVEYLNDPAKKVPGTYAFKNSEVVLNEDYTCNIDDLISNEVTKCSWEYDARLSKVNVDYTYKYKSYYGGTYTYDRSLELDFNVDDKSISYNYETYTKQK